MLFPFACHLCRTAQQPFTGEQARFMPPCAAAASFLTISEENKCSPCGLQAFPEIYNYMANTVSEPIPERRLRLWAPGFDLFLLLSFSVDVKLV
jgi:hypothetical protein